MPNVIEFLRDFRKRGQPAAATGDEDSETARILSLTAAEFSKESYVILLRSHLLGEDIYLVSNERCLAHLDDDKVAYLPDELLAIYGQSLDFIRFIHEVKRMVNGVVSKEAAVAECPVETNRNSI